MQNILHNSTDVYVLDGQKISELKDIALAHPLKRSRVCLHGGSGSPVQEMIIVAHHDTLIEPHRHPDNKPESYHIVEGNLLVRIYAEDGTILRNIELSDSVHPRFYRIHGGIWHQPIPLSEWVVYHEVFTGPFEKETDVIYASWYP